MKKCADLNISFANEKKLREYAVEELGNNPLTWRLILDTFLYYHDADYFESVGSEHEAIDIPAAQETRNQSTVAVYLLCEFSTTTGYGYFAIKHPNGFMTVYGHVN